jgi:hypothetical protein
MSEESQQTFVGSRRKGTGPGSWGRADDGHRIRESRARLLIGPGYCILRKEVIQPQVPLRLPCYDLVPITGFIFGACR